MLIHKKGDILQAEENIICHQVNIQGVMGGGLALQIATQYPTVEEKYKNYCIQLENKELMIGDYLPVKIGEHKYIMNCFTQNFNFDTNYKALKQVFASLLESCKNNNLSICIPYKYGCGIANGDWEEVSRILEGLSDYYKIDISVYELEKGE